MSDELSAEERRAWRVLYAVMSGIPSSLNAQLSHAARITLFEYHVLAMLSEAEATRMTLKELAENLSCSLSRLGHVVRKLEKRGWLTRSTTASSSDRGNRGMAVLTDVGFDTVTSLAEDHARQVRAMVFDVLDHRDAADLERISTKILGMICSPQPQAE